MSDQDKSQQPASQQPQNKSTQIKADPSRTNEQYIAEAEKLYIIPKLVREVFPDLIKLIFETESMDVDEREYWLQILPIMTEDQIKKFRDILVNEKEQLKKLDQDYNSEISKIDQSKSSALNEEEIKKRRLELQEKEKAAQQDESKREEDLLKQLDEIR